MGLQEPSSCPTLIKMPRLIPEHAHKRSKIMLSTQPFWNSYKGLGEKFCNKHPLESRQREKRHWEQLEWGQREVNYAERSLAGWSSIPLYVPGRYHLSSTEKIRKLWLGQRSRSHQRAHRVHCQSQLWTP
jgi:hypothetical protein